MGTLTAADVRPFKTLCEMQDQFDAIVRTKGTEEFRLRQFLDTACQLRPYYALFGLEPVSRARIQVRKPKDEPVSKWAGVLK